MGIIEKLDEVSKLPIVYNNGIVLKTGYNEIGYGIGRTFD